jgi:hypothetical protein
MSDGREEIQYEFVKLKELEAVLIRDDNGNFIGHPLPMYRGGEVGK